MIEFTKISATGNDFIVIDNRNEHFLPDPHLIQKICVRRTGGGADGLLLLQTSESLDFSMRYFNSDGSEGELCGNGARAIALFAYLKGIAPRSMTFRSPSGPHRAEVEEDKVKVEMPQPQNLDWKTVAADALGYRTVGFVEIGVPHLVVEVRDAEKVPVVSHGRLLRYNPEFSAGTNVDFIQILSQHRLKMRTYERGVEDETLACGTGATASVLLSFLKKKVDPPVTVEVPGGKLQIDFDRDVENIYLSGQVQPIYAGRLFLEQNEWMSLSQLEKSFRTQKK